MSLTVLMPTYNCASYIQLAIKSILIQSYKNYEFLIIDDGSTDNTEEIISRFKDSRIRYIKKRHTGFSDSLNYGLKVASYNLIARMDADDLSIPYRLENQLEFAKNNPQYDIISSWYGLFQKKEIIYLVKSFEEDEEIKKGLLLHSYVCHAACLFNRQLIISSGGYNKGPFEDYDLWLRIMKEVKFYNIPKVLYLQRFRKDSLSRLDIRDKYRIHYTIQKKYYEDLQMHFALDASEENLYKGWREYFCGDKRKAREYWIDKRFVLKDFKVFLAYLITLLPENIFIAFKEIGLRYRILYYLRFYEKEARELRSVFETLLNG